MSTRYFRFSLFIVSLFLPQTDGYFIFRYCAKRFLFLLIISTHKNKSTTHTKTLEYNTPHCEQHTNATLTIHAVAPCVPTDTDRDITTHCIHWSGKCMHILPHLSTKLLSSFCPFGFPLSASCKPHPSMLPILASSHRPFLISSPIPQGLC